MTEAPSSRVSSVVSMLGDLTAFAASFLIFGDVIAAGALGIAQLYVFDPHLETGIQLLSSSRIGPSRASMSLRRLCCKVWVVA